MAKISSFLRGFGRHIGVGLGGKVGSNRGHGRPPDCHELLSSAEAAGWVREVRPEPLECSTAGDSAAAVTTMSEEGSKVSMFNWKVPPES